MEPLTYARAWEADTSAQIRDWLNSGLHLMLSPVTEPPLAEGWQAIFVPGSAPGAMRATVQRKIGFAGGPETVVEDAPVHGVTAWFATVRATQRVAVFAGLTELHKTTRRDPETVAKAIARAYLVGKMTCGMIKAVWVE